MSTMLNMQSGRPKMSYILGSFMNRLLLLYMSVYAFKSLKCSCKASSQNNRPTWKTLLTHLVRTDPDHRAWLEGIDIVS